MFAGVPRMPRLQSYKSLKSTGSCLAAPLGGQMTGQMLRLRTRGTQCCSRSFPAIVYYGSCMNSRKEEEQRLSEEIVRSPCKVC